MNDLERSFQVSCGLQAFVLSKMTGLLCEEGYAWQISTGAGDFAYYLDPSRVQVENKRAVLTYLEQDQHPLVRIARWPRDFQSAMCVTGDIDALTIWDFAARLLGM